MTKYAALLVAIVAVLSGTANGFSLKPEGKVDLKNAVASAFTAATIATSALAPLDVQAMDMMSSPSFGGSSTLISEKVVREGIYGTYEADLTQTYDKAESTFKGAKETKSKKGKYTALLSVLVVGSFIIPMAQYFWYVKEDDSSDRFFASKAEPEPEPPKKKGWF